MSPEMNKPPSFSEVSQEQREQREDEALALRVAGHSYDEIAQQLKVRGGKGPAYRLVERAARRRLPNPDDFIAVAAIDALLERLWPYRRDPEVARRMRDLLHLRIAYTQPGLAGLPLPTVESDRETRARNAEQRKVRRRERRQQRPVPTEQERSWSQTLREAKAELRELRKHSPRPRKRR